MDSCVVVVDDEPDVLELVTDILEEDGAEVVPVDRPEGVIALESERRPDLVLMDLMLPGMNGIELARKLQNNGMRGTPMVAMSASPRMLRRAAESHLFEAMLAKPFELTALLGVVERHLGR